VAGEAGVEQLRRTLRPVKLWAFIGAVFLALTAYSWIDWAASGDIRATPRGPTAVPTWQVVSARLWEVLLVLGSLALVYFLIVKPWRRDRRLGVDGLLLISFVALWAFQDPFINYVVPYFTYNSELWNLGCPQCHVPGWQGPHAARMAEPLLFGPGLYIVGLLGIILLCNAIMSRSARRWPRLGNFGLVMIAIGFLTIGDFVMENIFMRSGMWFYGGAQRWVTLFHGRWYQFPITESLLWGPCWGILASLRYFRNDKGETVVERGIDEVRATPKQKTGLRALAFVGVLNTLMLVMYNIPVQWITSHSDGYPKNMISKSYVTNMMCGPGTTYACPGSRVPIPVGPSSAHLSPEGGLVAPHGVPIQTAGTK
jgi:hypothetical protein